MAHEQEAYFTKGSWISASYLKSLLAGGSSPIKGDEPYIVFGTKFHAYVLERDKYEAQWPDDPQRHVIEKLAEQIPGMRLTSLLLNEPEGKNEHEFYRTLPEHGCKARCKVDRWSPHLRGMLELKTLQARNMADLLSGVDKFHYDLSAAWYLDIVKEADYIVIGAVSKKGSEGFELPIMRGDDVYLAGKQKIKKALYKLRLKTLYEQNNQ